MNTTFVRWCLNMIDMEIMFSIDVSKHSSNVAVLVGDSVFKEFKILRISQTIKLLIMCLTVLKFRKQFLNLVVSIHKKFVPFFKERVGSIPKLIH